MLWSKPVVLASQILFFACFYSNPISAQETTDAGVLVLTGTGGDTPTGPLSATPTSLTGTKSSTTSSDSTTRTTSSHTSSTFPPDALTLTGSTTNSLNQTRTSTSTGPQPTNKTPCNLHVEFCTRKYSNITQVCAHNSPFVKANNAAANQALGVVSQLDDGIRMLQIQAHVVNGTVFLCHSSCDILNAGTMTDYLTIVAEWVQKHPYDVITILIGNAAYLPVSTYTSAIADSGLLPYVYTPPKKDMALSDWPTLSNMIITSSRVVVFMDYETDQNSVPYILDEFTYMWETPFDPIERAFPCTVQRPPDLSAAAAKSRMYIANHNLNTELSLLGNSLLVPTQPLLGETNAVSGFGSLGLAAQQCNETWGKPPTVLNVDYYNVGNGSVFEVAAKWNNVTYNATCCGMADSAGVRVGGGCGGLRGWRWFRCYCRRSEGI
ncbi:hypothetical protein GMDG_03620 [Pseudogymnoascus destructans 20631-21]|uniref:PLC-like phosphodiesterase n=1 Tax=Pseudogymnoascus destructans (strain ATCC MYA-4855 / 20631-21) TaxID=658429 RepID=L8G839_PSED2|nr:hypothetical protein GMDG_03620 [Pseudogymnoascus destructans 20631-21]